MAKKKTETFVFRGLGFPIKLVNVPMKKMAGERVIDINMNKLMSVVFEALAHKPTALTSGELYFIRSYLKMHTKEFGKSFGVPQTVVLGWESRKTKISPSLELCIRLFMMNYLKAKDKEFRALYNELNLEELSRTPKAKIHPITVDVVGREDLKIAL